MDGAEAVFKEQLLWGMEREVGPHSTASPKRKKELETLCFQGTGRIGEREKKKKRNSIFPLLFLSSSFPLPFLFSSSSPQPFMAAFFFPGRMGETFRNPLILMDKKGLGEGGKCPGSLPYPYGRLYLILLPSPFPFSLPTPKTAPFLSVKSQRKKKHPFFPSLFPPFPPNPG